MTAISTWMKEEKRDLEMNEYHEQYWNSFIKRISPKDEIKWSWRCMSRARSTITSSARTGCCGA